MIRATYGETAMIRVSVGRIRALGWDQGAVPGAIREIAGKTWDTVVANSTTRVTPTTNSGSAANSNVTIELATSKVRSRRSAAYAPIAIDNGIEMSPAH